MKLWYYAPPGSHETVDATSTRAALGIYMAIWTCIAVGVMALVAFAVWVFTGRQLEIHDSVLTFVGYWFLLVGGFNGIASIAGYGKQVAAPKMAEAEKTREETKVLKVAAATLAANGHTVADTVIPSEAPTSKPPEASTDIKPEDIP